MHIFEIDNEIVQYKSHYQFQNAQKKIQSVLPTHHAFINVARTLSTIPPTIYRISPV